MYRILGSVLGLFFVFGLSLLGFPRLLAAWQINMTALNVLQSFSYSKMDSVQNSCINYPQGMNPQTILIRSKELPSNHLSQSSDTSGKEIPRKTYLQGLFALQKGAIESADNLFQKCALESTRGGLCTYFLGYTHWLLGNVPKAHEVWQRQNLNRAFVGRCQSLAETALKDNDAAGALTAATQGVEFDPYDGYSQYLLGKAYMEQNDVSHAIPPLEMSLQPDAPAWMNEAAAGYLGRAYKQQGDLIRAIEMFHRVVDLNSQADWAWVELVSLHHALGQEGETRASCAALAQIGTLQNGICSTVR